MFNDELDDRPWIRKAVGVMALISLIGKTIGGETGRPVLRAALACPLSPPGQLLKSQTGLSP